MMNNLAVAVDLVMGWCVWSLAHNLGHRWWHAEMRQGKHTPYAHGEREHHRLYDSDNRDWQIAEDPRELFISFPFWVIAIVGLVFVAGYSYVRGWEHSVGFSVGLYISMIADHQLHILFHKTQRLPGPLDTLRRLHLIHHRTHRHNFFFVSGVLWDILFGTILTKVRDAGNSRSAKVVVKNSFARECDDIPPAMQHVVLPPTPL